MSVKKTTRAECGGGLLFENSRSVKMLLILMPRTTQSYYVSHIPFLASHNAFFILYRRVTL